MPLSRHFLDRYEQFGFDCRNRRFETCNADAYACPCCGASDRDRLYALYLQKRFPPGSGDSQFRLLDIAPREALSAHIRRHYPVVYRTADLQMEGVDDRINIMDMGLYPSDSFDAFICSHVLEHVPDDMKAMAELCRILKPGGWGITMVPIEIGLDGVYEDPTKATEAERWKHFGQGDHVRMYSSRGFVNRLQRAGFTVLALGREYFGERDLQRHGIGMDSVLYVSGKPIRCSRDEQFGEQR